MLKAIPWLKRLVFVVPDGSHDLFKEEFGLAKLAMPSVEALVVGPYYEFMVAVCPKLVEISNSGHQWMISEPMYHREEKLNRSMRLIKAAGAASKLERFDMREWWEPCLLEGTSSYSAQTLIC